jgi:hypothetical protein
MKKIIGFSLMVCIFVGSYAQNAAKLWESKPAFEVPESVIYVSNVNGSPLDKNGKGYLSKVALNGDIKIQQWITGLNAPKGLAILGNFLYVSDIDRIAKIDCKKNSILEFIEIPGSKFLNDVTVSDKGVLAVSDMMDNAVYLLMADTIHRFIRDEKLERVNGLFFEGETLYAGTNNIIYAINTADTALSLLVYIENTEGIDGLERFDVNQFIISDWSGKVQIVSADKEPLELLNFTDENYNAADIDYDINSKTLFIPTFFGNTVAAYKIE